MLIRTLWISASLLLSSVALAVPASSISTSPPTKICADLTGRIFKNCVDGSFPGLHALEISKDFITFVDVTDGTTGNLINWSIVASREPGHNKIIDVQFKTGTNFNGLFNVMPSTGTEDLSAYAKGALEFDVRILNRGNYNASLEVKLECLYPCQSKEYTLSVPVLNQWIKISLPIADMVRDGLDLTKMNIPFQIFPTWNLQDGAHFQVDNIRWVKHTPKSSSSSLGGTISSKSSSKAISSVAVSSVKSSAKSSSSFKSVSSASSKISSSASVKSSKASSTKSSQISSIKSSVASSVQSSAALLSCTYQEGGVYFDSVCSPWQYISAYEQNSDATIHQENLDGVGAIVNFAEVDSGDGNHQKVIDVLYKNNLEYNGIVRFHGPADAINGVDMSAYATGKFIFDIKVIANSNDGADLEFVLDCGWPCQNTERFIRPELNKWTTIELSVADLVRDGLTINKILTGFQISPTWGHQIGAHFQLDNIRWVKGTAPATTQVCWAQHFSSYDIPNLRIDQFSAAIDPVQIEQIAPTSIFTPNWPAQSKWGYAAGVDANVASCGANSTLSASVYIPASYVNDGHLTVSFYAIDQGNGMAFSQPISVAILKANGWNTVGTDLGFLFSSGLNTSNLAFVGVIFDANGKDPSINGVLKIDNLIVTQPIQ